MPKIRKPKLKKFKSTHFTEIGYNILRKEKSKLEKMRKDGGKIKLQLIFHFLRLKLNQI